ncbi:NAD-dependent epimerase/dehydratase family protein [Planctomicrobium sp. SH664]|uniref:NAD-dependent epimerase/dehydratase family protein n=1 Tax=Planctomicrobium sp. SH664 TaxID=3448125 RepID=UPI003F5B60D2
MAIRAFITGGTGFLGRRLIRSLLQHDVRLRCLVRGSSDVASLLGEVPPEKRRCVQLIEGDLMQPHTYEEHLEGVDVVYHLAAALSGCASGMFLNTVVPTRQLVECAVRSQVKRFVHVSSLGVYGTKTLSNGSQLDETTPIDPLPHLRDPYTFSKIRQEEVVRQAAERYGLPTVIVRPGVIYGPGRSLLTSRVGLSLGPLLLRMGGSQQLPYTHVENCADAIKLAGIAAGTDGEIVNVVDDHLPTGRQIVSLLRKSGQRVPTLWLPRPLIGPLSSIYEWYSNWSEGQLPAVITAYKSAAIWKPLRYSNRKAKELLDWQPRITTEDGLRSTIVS